MSVRKLGRETRRRGPSSTTYFNNGIIEHTGEISESHKNLAAAWHAHNLEIIAAWNSGSISLDELYLRLEAARATEPEILKNVWQTVTWRIQSQA